VIHLQTISFLVNERDVEGYAEVSGDYNPIHFDLEHARKHGFPDTIVHGMLTMGKIWSVLSGYLLSPIEYPDKYELKFLSPVFVGANVTLNVNRMNNQLSVVGLCAGKPILKGNIWLQNIKD
jgi:3-hydroxybutyryl-CoA dehydratase